MIFLSERSDLGRLIYKIQSRKYWTYLLSFILKDSLILYVNAISEYNMWVNWFHCCFLIKHYKPDSDGTNTERSRQGRRHKYITVSNRKSTNIFLKDYRYFFANTIKCVDFVAKYVDTKCFFRNTSWALNKISTFLFLAYRIVLSEPTPMWG
jgi:hypothetical protein